jgi:hypothetical protein
LAPPVAGLFWSGGFAACHGLVNQRGEKCRMTRPEDLPPSIYQLLELLASKPQVRLSGIVDGGLGDAFWAAWPLGLLEVEKSTLSRLQAGLQHACYRQLPESCNPTCWLSQEGRRRLDLHRLWQTEVGDPLAAQPMDKKKDTAAKSKKSCPRNLKELKDLERRVRRDKQQGMTQEDSVREYVEKRYPNLATEDEILNKRDSLIRSLNRYKQLFKSTR